MTIPQLLVHDPKDNVGVVVVEGLDAVAELVGGFDAGTGPNSSVYAVAVQGDGKVIIAGDFSTVNGTARTRVARLHSPGLLQHQCDQ